MTRKTAKRKAPTVKIEARENKLRGEYSNLVMIHHNREEFTLNFIYIFPNGAQGSLLKSMIISPGHVKRIAKSLTENIARYESQFGDIKELSEEPTSGAGAGELSFLEPPAKTS